MARFTAIGKRIATVAVGVYFFALAAAYIYLTYTSVDFTVVVLGPTALAPRGMAPLRVIAFDERTGHRLPISAIGVQAGVDNVPVKIRYVGGIGHLWVPPSGNPRGDGDARSLALTVTTAHGTMRATVRIPRGAERRVPLRFPPIDERRDFLAPGEEQQFPYRVALIPEFRVLQGDQRNRVFVRVTDPHGAPLVRPLTVSFRPGGARFVLTTNALGLARFSFKPKAPIYHALVTVIDAKAPQKLYSFRRQLRPQGLAFKISASGLLRSPPSTLKVRVRSLTSSALRYCDHLWQGMWLDAVLLPNGDAVCPVKLRRPGLHAIQFTDHFALPGTDSVTQLVLVTDRPPHLEFRALALALAKSRADEQYTRWLSRALTAEHLKHPAAGRLLAAYLLTILPHKPLPATRLLDTRKADLSRLKAERALGHQWLLRLLVASTICLLLALVILVGRSYLRTQRLMREQLLHAADDNPEIDGDFTDTATIRPYAHWFPLMLLGVIAVAILAVILLLVQL